MSDALGADEGPHDADRSAKRDAERGAAMQMARDGAEGRVGMLVHWLAGNMLEHAEPQLGQRGLAAYAHAAIRGESLDEANSMMPLADLIYATRPDIDPAVRLAALDEIWRRHMDGMQDLIKQRAAELMR